VFIYPLSSVVVWVILCGRLIPYQTSITVQCFELFFNKEIIQKIVRETNRYAEQYKNARGKLFSFKSFVRSWTPVTESEIYTVLGLFLLKGIVQKPTARSYFSKRRVISTPGFTDVISRERFELICKFLHFIDNESLPTHQGPPILFKCILWYVIWT